MRTSVLALLPVLGEHDDAVAIDRHLDGAPAGARLAERSAAEQPRLFAFAPLRERGPIAAARPVAAPVTISASARQSSAVRAASATSMSAVIAWLACFFLMSAHTATPSAPICRR